MYDKHSRDTNHPNVSKMRQPNNDEKQVRNKNTPSPSKYSINLLDKTQYVTLLLNLNGARLLVQPFGFSFTLPHKQSPCVIVIGPKSDPFTKNGVCIRTHLSHAVLSP